MKQLSVPYCQALRYGHSISAISAQLDQLEKQSLDFTPWPEYPYKPAVQFAAAHSNDCIFLKYFVEEKSIRAAAGSINGPVWEDACVEFFVSFGEEGYYNLEFNCIGTALMGFGKEKPFRKRLDAAVIQKIKYTSCIRNQDEGNIQWELTVAIPVEVFIHHQIGSLKNKQCRANFYKCGDALPEPHFVSWSNIEAPRPNFHLPQFFGSLGFE